MPSSPSRAAAVTAALLLTATGLPAQAVSLDEGTYRIQIDGIEAGMETFSIRQNGSGADMVVIARGRVVLDTGTGSQEVQVSIQLAGSALRPAAYDIDERGSQSRRVNARITGSRASARITSPEGEILREYLIAEGAVLVAEGMAHQYYFLARHAGGKAASVPLVLPGSSRQVSATVAIAETGSVSVAGARLDATHYVVESAGGPTAHVWADGQGRVLKVEVPSRNYLAIRTAAPAA